ncbi:hypothetical protein AVEN_9509-1 [Araneus ventricosus]|uniref:Uncharacterized protein n=1 Tax=Araneus ventricosus TaxID=182803 RepID=A0A4Y2W636_ARAVE|nr:hypothetical protein AVEN_9509-1 [Araneus ventricosus]
MSENCNRCGMKSLPVIGNLCSLNSKLTAGITDLRTEFLLNLEFSMEYVTSKAMDDFSNLIFLGCDGRFVKAGVFNGVIRRLSLKLHRPIQWVICLLKFNEFPLRHLFERKSSGPSSYTGDIGRNLKAYEKLPLVVFNSIECDLPGIDPTNLSFDQKYLLDSCMAINSSDPAKSQPGRVYANSWFRIEVHHSIKDVARHLWHFISSSRFLPKKYRDIIEPVISRNAYFEAPKNMLLAMLTDERCHMRTLAARRIIKAREIGKDGNCVRRFVTPAVNIRATDSVDLIDWLACNVTPPTVLRHISSHEL